MSLTAPSHPERRADDPWSQTSVDRRRPRVSTRRQAPPKGWYPDPPALRFWDGEAWTVLTRPAGPPRAEEKVLDGPTGFEMAVPAEAATEASAATVAPFPVRPPEPWVAVAPSTAPTEVPVHAPTSVDVEPRPRLRRELLILLWVALVALGAGGVVAALGIALTV